MIIYQVSNENTIIEFSDLEQADSFLKKEKEKGFNWELKEIEKEIITIEPSIDYNSMLVNNLAFGQLLIKTFLLDNYQMPKKFEVKDSVELMTKFENVIKLCQLGDIKNVLYLIQSIETDTIFTQERKEKYQVLIENYLLNN